MAVSARTSTISYAAAIGLRQIIVYHRGKLELKYPKIKVNLLLKLDMITDRNAQYCIPSTTYLVID